MVVDLSEESKWGMRNVYDPQCLFDVMDTYAALGRHIQIWRGQTPKNPIKQVFLRRPLALCGGI